MLQFPCVSCGEPIAVSPELRDQRIVCGNCNTRQKVPSVLAPRSAPMVETRLPPNPLQWLLTVVSVLLFFLAPFYLLGSLYVASLVSRPDSLALLIGLHGMVIAILLCVVATLLVIVNNRESALARAPRDQRRSPEPAEL